MLPTPCFHTRVRVPGRASLTNGNRRKLSPRRSWDRSSLRIALRNPAHSLVRGYPARTDSRGQYLGVVTVSINVADYPTHGSTLTDLIAADKALYQAKREGRDRVVVAPVPLPRKSTAGPYGAGVPPGDVASSGPALVDGRLN